MTILWPNGLTTPPPETPESWAPVVGYEGFYEVSTCGRIRSVDRVVRGRAGARFYPGRLLRPAAHPKSGHQLVRLSDARQATTRQLHRIVLEAFVGPCPPGMEGCHGDGDPENNRIENLRWDTRRENVRDRVRHGTDRSARKTHCPRGHALSGPNLVPSALARGARSCLACSRAQSRAKNTGAPFTQELSDQFYETVREAA